MKNQSKSTGKNVKAISKKTKVKNAKTELYGYQKLGRLKQSIAKEIGRKSADIYVDTNHLKHIKGKHKDALKIVGLDELTFIKTVVDNFNEIRTGSNNSLLLIIATKENNQVVVIDLNYSLKENFWEVKTAQVRRAVEINKKVLLWQRTPSSE